MTFLSGGWFGTGIYDFPFSWEWNNDPNWRRTHIFQRGRAKTTNQVIYFFEFYDVLWSIYCVCNYTSMFAAQNVRSGSGFFMDHRGRIQTCCSARAIVLTYILMAICVPLCIHMRIYIIIYDYMYIYIYDYMYIYIYTHKCRWIDACSLLCSECDQ